MSLADEIFAGFAGTGAIQPVTVLRRDGSVQFDTEAFINDNFNPGTLSSKGNTSVQRGLNGELSKFIINKTDMDAAGFTVEDPLATHDKIVDEYDREYGVLSARLNRAGSWIILAISTVMTKKRTTR